MSSPIVLGYRFCGCRVPGS